MSAHPRQLAVTPKGLRYVSLCRLARTSLAQLACLGNTYAALGLIERRPEFLYDAEAVIAAIVDAEFPDPAFRVIHGGKAA